jgi:twitching motility protein PilU
MKTFDQAILELYHQGKISQEEALANADSRHNLEVKIRLEHGNLDSGGTKFSMEDS